MKMTNLIVIGTLALLVSACGKQRTVAEGEKEITLHCSGEKYTSDKKFFRATATGKSMNLEIAKKKAYTNTRSTLASLIQVTVKSVNDNYVKSSAIGENESAMSRFESLSREVVNQTLSNVVVSCEKLTKDKQGNYTYYIAMEVSKDDILNGINNSLSQDQELKVDYNYEKYKETFNKEMDKFANR